MTRKQPRVPGMRESTPNRRQRRHPGATEDEPLARDDAQRDLVAPEPQPDVRQRATRRVAR